MPFLRSFCFFATFGIFFLWLFQLMFFVGVLALDEYRVDAKRDGCFGTKLKKWKPSAFLQKYSFHSVFKDYIGPFLMKAPVKVSKSNLFMLDFKAAYLASRQEIDTLESGSSDN